MWTILSLGALVALSLASCSTSSNSLSRPDIETDRVQEPTAQWNLLNIDLGRGLGLARL